MKKQAWLFLMLALGCSAAIAAWINEYRQAEVHYIIYGGGLADRWAPGKGDRKIAFQLKGNAAREMFNAIGPDILNHCGADSDTRIRARDHENISCIRSKGKYFCSFGFDLTTGKSIGGSVC